MGTSLHCYTCAGVGKILESWGKAEPKWHCCVMVEAVNHRWLHPTSILDVYKVIEHLHMLWMGIWVHPYTVIPNQVVANVGKLGQGGAQLTFWCHGWGCKPPLTASHIHIGCLLHVWAPLYAVDGHMGVPLHCYTCAGGGKFFGNWGKVEPKWCCGVMVEAVNHRWLNPTSILDVYYMFVHLHMLWMGIWVHPYTDIPVQVRAKLWNIGVRWSPNDVVVSGLRL